MISFLVFFMGLLCIVFGLISWKKKKLWVHQGIFPRPVDKDGYTRFMGILDIIMGLSWITIGAYYFQKRVPSRPILTSWIIYIALAIYGEIKYKIDTKQHQHTN